MCCTWQNLNLVWNKATIGLSSSSQQQSNLIPGLNLNALGIFSSGLPVLPPAAGPRGAVPPVSPAGYNPFLVSALTFCFNKLFLHTTLVKKKKIERDFKILLSQWLHHCFSNLSQSCAAQARITFHLIKQFVPSKWFTRFSPEVFLKKKHYCVDSGLPAWCCTQFETSRIPPSHLHQMSQSVCKTKSPLFSWSGQARVVWGSMWECDCVPPGEEH